MSKYSRPSPKTLTSLILQPRASLKAKEHNKPSILTISSPIKKIKSSIKMPKNSSLILPCPNFPITTCLMSKIYPKITMHLAGIATSFPRPRLSSSSLLRIHVGCSFTKKEALRSRMLLTLTRLKLTSGKISNLLPLSFCNLFFIAKAHCTELNHQDQPRAIKYCAKLVQTTGKDCRKIIRKNLQNERSCNQKPLKVLQSTTCQ